MNRWEDDQYLNKLEDELISGKFTLLNKTELRNIRDRIRQSLDSKVNGDYVECGTWRGGASIYARACLPDNRTVRIFDSFQGFPPGSPDYDPMFVVPLETVKANFERFGLGFKVDYSPGFFAETVGSFKKPIMGIHLDVDSEPSYAQCLRAFWPLINSGGFMVLDEGALPGVQKVLAAFFPQVPPQKPVDRISVWIQKP